MSGHLYQSVHPPTMAGVSYWIHQHHDISHRYSWSPDEEPKWFCSPLLLAPPYNQNLHLYIWSMIIMVTLTLNLLNAFTLPREWTLSTFDTSRKLSSSATLWTERCTSDSLCVAFTKQLRYWLKYDPPTLNISGVVVSGGCRVGRDEACTSASEWGSEQVRVFLPPLGKRQRPGWGI